MATHAERGSLPLALAVTIVVTGLVSVVTASVVMGQQQTRFDESYERALHLAEEGADRVLERGEEGCWPADDEGPAGSDDPREWVLNAARDAVTDNANGDGAVLHQADGDAWAYGICLTGEDDEIATVYGVGVADRGERAVERVVRYDLSESGASVEAGLIAGCPEGMDPDWVALETDGGIDFGGALVHSNCSMDLGNAVSGDFQMVDSEGDEIHQNRIDDVNMGAEAIELPDYRAADFYDQRHEYASWRDLCDGGEVKEPAKSDGGPCTGDEVLSDDDGLHYDEDDSTWEIDPEGDDGSVGVLYVDGADASIESEGEGTLLISGEDGGGDLSLNHQGGGSGGGEFATVDDALPMVVDGSIAEGGSGNAQLKYGTLIVRGHIDIGGTPDLTGSLIVLHENEKPSNFSGNVSLRGPIDRSFLPDVGGRTLSWEEL